MSTNYVSDGDLATPENLNAWLNTVKNTALSAISPEEFGEVGQGNDAALLESAFQAAANEEGSFVVLTREYVAQVDISLSNVRVFCVGDAAIKLPNGTVASGSTTPEPALTISGDNVTIIGRLIVDGNAANNGAGSYTEGDLASTFLVSGDNCSILGQVIIKDAYYDALVVWKPGGGEVENFYADLITADNPVQRAAVLWAMNGFHINAINVVNVNSVDDHRIRTGTASVPTEKCRNGYIGNINSPANILIVEQKTERVHIERVRVMHGKLEDCTDVSVGSWVSKDNIRPVQYSFAFSGATRCSVGSLTVLNHDGDNTTAVMFEDSAVDCVDCHVGHMHVEGSQNTGDQVLFRGVRRFKADFLVCLDGVGNGVRIDEDAAYNNGQIYFGAVVASGNGGTYDFRVDPALVPDVYIGYIQAENIVGSGQVGGGIAGFPGVGAYVTFTVDAGTGACTIVESRNVDSVTELGVGQYRVNYDGFVGRGLPFITAHGTSQVEITSESQTRVDFELRNSSGTLTRPTQVHVMVYNVPEP